MGTDCRIMLPHRAGVQDVADVIGLLLGKKGELKTLDGGGLHLVVEGVKVTPSSVVACADINITGALYGTRGESRGDRWFMYHFEYNTDSKRDRYTKSGRGIQPKCTELNIAMCVELAKFFGGEVDYNDCDSKNVNFRAPEAKDLSVCNGKKWDDFQRRMAVVNPLTKEQIARYQKYAAY